MRLNLYKRGLAVAGLMLMGQAGIAQQLPVMNHYIYNPYLYNPSRAGQEEQGRVSMNFKKQWVAMPNSPITGMMTLESPITGTRLGVGGMIYSDKMHIVNRLGGLATVSYHLPLAKDQVLSGGISLGILNQRLAVSEATVSDPNDPQLANASNTGTAMDFSLGLNYRWRDLQVGLSMLQGLGNAVKYLNTTNGTTADFSLSRHFLMSAGYKIDFGAKKDFGMQPTLLLRFLGQGIPAQVEVNALGHWRKLVYLGVGFRSGNASMTTSALMSTLGVNIKDKVFFGYTVDFGVNANVNSSLGTQHEIMVAFKFGKDKEMERKIKQMDADMADVKRKDAEQEKRLAELGAKVDSLNNNQQAMSDEQKRLADEQKRLSDEQKRLADEQEKMKGRLDEQEKLNAAQQAQLDRHEKELEEIRKRLDMRSSEFKRLGSVTFDEGKTALTKVSQSELDALLPTLKKDPNLRIYLYGRASTKGSRTTNEQLSMKRAVAVRQFLINAGIPGDNIELIPFGASDPENGSSKDNANDRRVDIYVTK